MADSKLAAKPADNSPPRTDAAATIPPGLASIETSRTGAGRKRDLLSGESPIPTVFGRYQIERELGKGAMGVVYLARDTQLDRQVALKIPKKSVLEETDALERFYREAKTTSKIRHPNICPVYDVGAIDGTHYLTMAYIPGKPVSSFLGKAKLPAAKQVALLIRKIALALEEAHKQGVVHRDLKPSNVMLDDRNEPIVMDFGLACQLNTAENARLTHSGAILGTPAYMAPEQVRGELSHVGPVSDIYALGVMMYQFLTGELPFSGPIMMVFAQIISNLPKKPSEVKPEVDPTLEAICLKMMAKEIDQRYGSMKEVAAALTEFLKTGSVTGLETTSMISSSPTINSPEIDFDNLPAVSDVVSEPRKPRSKKSAKSSARRSRQWYWPAVLSALVLSVLGVFAVLISVSSGKGTVLIDVADPEVRVRLENETITIDDPMSEPLTIRAKPQTLLIDGPGFQGEVRSFTLQRGEEKRLSVVLKNGRPEVIDTPADAIPEENVPQTEAAAELAAQELMDNPPETVAVASPATEGWVDLLPQAERGPDSRWLTNEKGFWVGFGGGGKHVRSRLLLPAAPHGSYELELSFQFGKVPNETGVLVNLPVGNREVTFAWAPRRPKATGLAKVQGRGRGEQKSRDITVHRALILESQRSYVMHAAVTVAGDQGEVMIQLNGSPWVSWKGAIADLSRAQPWTEPKANALGLEVGVSRKQDAVAAIILSAIRYREVSALQETVGEFEAAADRSAPLAGATHPTEPTPVVKSSDGWNDLFNGKDLSGWTQLTVDGTQPARHQSADRGWQSENGEIVCSSTSPGWLRYDAPQGDFELSLECQLPAGGNTGVLVRYSGTGPLALKSTDGLEIQLEDDPSQKTMTQESGAIYGIVPPTTWEFHSLKWNTLVVRCVGRDFTVMLNGKQVAHGTDQSHPALKSVPLRGLIGISNWGGKALGARLRNLRLRPLDEATLASQQAKIDGVKPDNEELNASPTPAVKNDGWVNLLDANLRAHWKHFGLQGQGDYATVDGVLKKSTPLDRGVFAHDREFANFLLTADYRLTTVDDVLRVFFRLQPNGNRPPTQALSVLLMDDRSNRLRGHKRSTERTNGALYDLVGPPRPVEIPFGDWHHLEIRAVGPKVTVKIDSKVVLDGSLKQLKDLPPDSEAFNDSGIIGVQYFKGTPELRNLRVQPMDDQGKPVVGNQPERGGSFPSP